METKRKRKRWGVFTVLEDEPEEKTVKRPPADKMIRGSVKEK